MSSWPTKEEIDARARSWLGEHWPSGCPTCRGTEYIVTDELMLSLPVRDGVLRPLETFVGHTYVQAFCQHCGFMVQVSSTVLGLTVGTGS